MLAVKPSLQSLDNVREPGRTLRSAEITPVERDVNHAVAARLASVADIDADRPINGARLAALVAAALRDADRGVIVRGAADAPTFLVFGPSHALPASACMTPPRERAIDAAAGADRGDADRMLLTLLFTDIVSSTETVERLGDRAWQRLLEQHWKIVRSELAAFGGTEVDNAGDGFFATFDRPARAVRCAEAIDAALARIGLAVRAGIHAGECAVREGRVNGVAVHVAARIAAMALPGEVLVSATVRDLVAGSELAFLDRDWHALRGLTGERQLFALQRRSAS